MLYLCVATWLGRFVYLRLTLKPTPRLEYWQAQIEGIDPPGNNAADTEAVYKLLNESVWHHTREQDMPGPLTSTWSKPGNIEWRKGVPRAKPFTHPEYVQLRSWVRIALNAGWSEPLWTQMSGGVSGVDCFANRHEYWCRVLLLHSRVSRERGEGMDICMENWRMVISLARQIIRPRLSYYQYTASKYIRSTAQEMIFTAREPYDRINVRLLADEIQAILGEPMKPSDLLEGERLLLHMLLECVYVRQGGDWLVVSEVRSVFNFSFDLREAPTLRLWNLTSPFFHNLSTSRRRVDAYIESLNALTCLADFATYGPKNAAGFRPLRPNSIDGLPIYGGGAPEYAVHDYYVALGELEAALTMLALSEYHRANGSYPRELDELVPKYLPRTPIDYADRKPLRYRRGGAEYVLYSVGYDGEDDGGIGEPTFNRFKPDQDVVFTLSKRPER